eukprot:CAMPEP_0201730750 /NCGR_PEP_ID=MMETSP0593-20130828/23367_1 /ASSEMBLY_ACC=CAM_ASM_000672 /TAXON_ID=267983 /ORGANISM="Skeletonema japonicum, Strain CCMP2506" /LENGTH=238 /DNA_ID=CAMNT_0048223367 /DNA_START=9 /DNA_END=725 /DNA_ORIENTATION=-
MTMKATNVQPPPLLLPASAYSPYHHNRDDIHYWEAADDYDFDDTGSIDSMSTITTTCEAADDMIEFVVTFDHPCVVVYLLDQPQQPRDGYCCNALQPHYDNGAFGVSNSKEYVINTKVALLLVTQLEKYHPVLLPRATAPVPVVQDASIIARSKHSSWQGYHYSYESLPTFRVPDDINNKCVGGAPLPTYLVRPRKGYQVPASKRFRVTPECSPLCGSPAFIPPVYISVPNPLAHIDG